MPIRLSGPSVLTLLVGALFVAVGLYGYVDMGRFLDRAQETTATVVSVVHDSATPKGRIHPVVKFTTRDGREITARSEQHHNVQPGDRLQVLYDPARPENIEISTLERANKRRVMFSGFGVLLGLAVCASGLGLDFRRTAQRSRAPAAAIPPLDHQIAHASAIVLAATEAPGVYRIREIWKDRSGSLAPDRRLPLDTRMHELLGYEPREGEDVVLFFTDGLPANAPLEILPVSDGAVTYGPGDEAVRQRATLEALRSRVQRAPPGA